MILSTPWLVILALIIIGSLILNYKKSKHVKISGPLAIYHTKRGLRFINNTAKKAPKFWKAYATLGIVVGFGFMAYTFYSLVGAVRQIFITPEMSPAAVPVIPGITIPLWSGIIGLINQQDLLHLGFYL
jgi:cyanate permease